MAESRVAQAVLLSRELDDGVGARGEFEARALV